MKKYTSRKSKKRLGQNFLKSSAIARDLVHAAEINARDTVVEVGPGKGNITKLLLERAKKVIAVEKDKELIEYLQEKFSAEIKNKKLILIHEDILKFNPKSYKLIPNSYKLVGNIPYYLTARLFRTFLECEIQPKTIAFIIQKEVAKRIVARDGKESILSISVKAYGIPRYIKTIKARYFSPQPKVDSAILVIENISKKYFKNIQEDKFFELIKIGFSSKRKKLVTNFKNPRINPRVNPRDYPRVFTEVFEDAGISPDARAEDLSLDDWRGLIKKLL